MPLVSVVMSVYNGEKTLKKALDSISSQSYISWELIVINDASTDNTLIILKEFKKKFPDRIKIINNKKNIGLTKSLNIGISFAKGDYIARLDADDWYHKEKLQRQIGFLEKNKDYGVVGTYYTNIYKETGEEKLIKLPVTNEEIKRNLIKKNPFGHSTVVIRKNLLVENKYSERVVWGQDYDLLWRLSRITKMANLPENLCYRTVPIINRKSKKQLFQLIKTRWRYMDRLNLINYLYLIQPIFLACVPNSIKKILRSL